MQLASITHDTYPGLTEVHHHQPSLHPPTSTQTASLRGVATGTQEITSPNHTSLFSGSHDFAMHNPTFIVYPPGAGSQQLEHSAGEYQLFTYEKIELTSLPFRHDLAEGFNDRARPARFCRS